jgi:hypothetical protein
MKYIDAHIHVWTPDTGHYPLAMQPASFTPRELFKHTEANGVCPDGRAGW